MEEQDSSRVKAERELKADVDRLSSLWPLVVAQSLRFARIVYFAERNQNEDGERVDGLDDRGQSEKPCNEA